METALLSYCPEHPNVPILHEWKKTVYHIRNDEGGVPISYDHHYYCSICHKEVCSPEEFEKRIALLFGG